MNVNIPTGMEGSDLYDVRESLLILSYRYSLHTFIPSLPSFFFIGIMSKKLRRLAMRLFFAYNLLMTRILLLNRRSSAHNKIDGLVVVMYMCYLNL